MADAVVWAGVDVGTNSVKLLVARVAAPPLGVREVLCHDVEITRMGENLGQAGVIGEPGQQRAMQAIRGLLERASAHQPAGISMVGMEAFRRASNAGELVDRIEREVGVRPRILRGVEEADLGRTAVMREFAAQTADHALLLVDIGGGSTELALSDPSWEVSVPCGAVLTTESYLHNDPPLQSEMLTMLSQLRERFEETWSQAPSCTRKRLVIGVGGTVTTYAAISLQMEEFDRSRIHRHPLLLTEIESITTRLAGMPLRQRSQVVGLHAARAPVILGGGGILQSVLEAIGEDKLVVSEANLLHSVVEEGAARYLAGGKA